jgi:hypothetical protein
MSWGCSRPAPASHPSPGTVGGASTDSLVRASADSQAGASADSQEIDSRAAVFFRQDSLRLVRIKAVVHDRVYESLTHDCLFETKYVRSVLKREWPALRVIDVSTSRWLIFRKKNGDRKTIDVNAVNDLCGVFLFDGVKDPTRADMPNINTALWNYFGEGGKK